MTRNHFYDAFDLSDARVEDLDTVEFARLVARLPGFDEWEGWAVTEVHSGHLQPLCTSVSRSRVASARSLLSLYEAGEIAPFKPVLLRYPSHPNRTVTQRVFPPVILARGSNRIILDGMHRLYAALELGHGTISALVITSRSMILPGDPLTWGDVASVEESPEPRTKFRNFNAAGFRDPFTKTLNAEWLWSEER